MAMYFSKCPNRYKELQLNCRKIFIFAIAEQGVYKYYFDKYKSGNLQMFYHIDN